MQALTSSRVAGFSRPAARVAARRSAVAVQASTRPLWQPGTTPPAHLDGSMPGDFGFDPLNLGVNKDALEWYRNAELQNGRWAMLGVAGILFPAELTRQGLLNVPDWADAGRVYNDSEGAIPFSSLLMVQFFLFNFVEIKRWEDMKKPGSQAEPGSFLGFESSFKGTGVSGYPGGPFNPLGLGNSSEESMTDFKWREIRNGRLAMVAFLGFAAQHAATGKGPIDNLVEHLADPWANNFCSNGVSVPITIF
ncbi:light-harvesting of photosystem I [Micractinium conductrix]|uniref:Chlorophyll a-b binding protein, chloroplastic n=1 Tax=Micractinium conductrix TaxID=554055 RepID=A0A2P6VRN1_9CHLO|nr:light-harvesting of photosystem I [Micractinium conductrix]|eukprot:PSC76753.1 light-harvesting of photosystem I [Micractinium conductrix]